MPTDERCETCREWRTPPVGEWRSLCPWWGYVSGADASCGYWAEPLPFDDEPVEEDEQGAS
jgi:hypothetical protein